MNSARKEEILAVKQLGEEIGYGNMMSIASAIWSVNLEKQGLPINGAFVPIIDLLVKDEDLEYVTAERSIRIQEVKEVLKD
jgi:hypothetical protein